MCELLIRLTDANPKSAQSYKQGDVMDIRPDEYRWSRKESLDAWVADGNHKRTWHGRTAIVKCPGVPVEKYASLLEEDVVELAIVDSPDPADRMHMNKRRKERLDIAQFTRLARDFKEDITETQLVNARQVKNAN